MTIRTVGKVWDDWITVTASDDPDLPNVGIHFGDVPLGHSYILPPDKAEELAETILKAAASLGGS